MKKGLLFVISAPSGAGKSSLITALLKDPAFNLQLSVSHTTRLPRLGEVDGQHYYFTDRFEFQKMLEQGEFVESALVFGNHYGTSIREIDVKLSQGHVLLDIDWQGARLLADHFPLISIFILPPSFAVLKQRLLQRNLDSIDTIDNRMSLAMREISHANEYQYLIENDVFDLALSHFRSIVLAEELKAGCQSALLDRFKVESLGF